MNENERTIEEIFMDLSEDIKEDLGRAFMRLQDHIKEAKEIQDKYNGIIKRIDEDNSDLWSIFLRTEYGDESRLFH